MSRLEQVALVVAAVWLLSLSAAVLVLVRQVGLLTVRLSVALPHYDLDDLGPVLGTEVPPTLLEALGPAAADPRDLVFFSATCGPCRQVAEDLRTVALDPRTTALVAGDLAGARAFAELLPAGLTLRYDPQATEAAEALGVQAVPYGVRVTGGVVTGKAYLNSAADLGRLSGQLSVAGKASDGGRGA